jgi:hypothetical protein
MGSQDGEGFPRVHHETAELAGACIGCLAWRLMIVRDWFLCLARRRHGRLVSGPRGAEEIEHREGNRQVFSPWPPRSPRSMSISEGIAALHDTCPTFSSPSSWSTRYRSNTSWNPICRLFRKSSTSSSVVEDHAVASWLAVWPTSTTTSRSYSSRLVRTISTTRGSTARASSLET